MKFFSVHHVLFLLIVAVVMTTPALGQVGVMYGINPDFPEIMRMDTQTGDVLEVIELSDTDPGKSIDGGTGLAVHPTTGQLWAILLVPETDQYFLGIIDPVSGHVDFVGPVMYHAPAPVGPLDILVDALTFSEDGTLYGVTSDFDPEVPAALFSITLADGSATRVRAFSTDDTFGENIAYNPEDGLIYHTSGDFFDGSIFQVYDPLTDALTDIPWSGDGAPDEVLAIEFDAQAGHFVMVDWVNLVWHVRPDGYTTVAGLVGLCGCGVVRGLASEGIFNQVPTANPDEVTTAEDQAITISVLSNDADPDGDRLTVSLVDEAQFGSTILNADGSFAYTPFADFNGSDRFDYVVTDEWGETDTEAVFITVTPVNDPPVAVDDAAETDEDVTIEIDVLENDTDVEGPLSVEDFSQGEKGVVESIPGGVLRYTPAPDWAGSDSFTYTVSDGMETDEATVSVTVNPVNDPPVAEDDSGSVFQGDSIILDIMANDSDPEGDVLNVVDPGSPSLGTVLLLENGHLEYTATETADGDDVFTYTVSDAHGAEVIGTIRIHVQGAGADGDGVDDDVEMGAPNDGDGNADGIPDAEQSNVASLQLSSGPHLGEYVTFVLHGVGRFERLREVDHPDPEAFPEGLAAPFGFFEYRVSGIQPGARVQVDILVPEGSVPAAYWKHGPTTNGGSDKWYDFAYSPEVDLGALILQGRIELALQDGALGDDDFSENGVIHDPGAPIVLNNAVPVAVDDLVDVDEDTFIEMLPLANDTDADGDNLELLSVSEGPFHGVIEVIDNTITYAPDADYFGPDSLSYFMSDEHSAVARATVRITVLPVQDAPVAVDDSVATPGNTPVTIAFFENDHDPDGDVFHIASQGLPAHGTAVYQSDRTVVYTPNPGFSGSDSWTYSITDGPANSGEFVHARIHVQVGDIQAPPLAVPDVIQTTKNTPVTVAPLSNDTDPNGDSLTLTGVSAASSGTVVDNGDGTITYIPDTGFTGVETFTYEVTDGPDASGETITAEIRVTVVNQAPVFASSQGLIRPADRSLVVLGSGTVEFEFAEAVDPDGDSITWLLEPVHSMSATDVRIAPLEFDSRMVSVPDTLIIQLIEQSGIPFETGTDRVLRFRPGITDGSDIVFGPEASVTFWRPVATQTDAEPAVPASLVLHQNYPNPFNPTTRISFGLPESGRVVIEIVDAMGRRAVMMDLGILTAGWHTHGLRMDEFASGLYVYRIVTPTGQESRSMHLLK